MQICVKTLVGKNLSLDINADVDSCTILMVKEALEEHLEAPAGKMRLVFSGMTLEDSKTLADYSIDRATARGGRMRPACNMLASLIVHA